MEPDSDRTVRIETPRPTARPSSRPPAHPSARPSSTVASPPRRRGLSALAIAAFLLCGALGSGAWLWGARQAPLAAIPHKGDGGPPPAGTVARPAVPPAIQVPYATAAELHARSVGEATVLRLRENDRIFVLLFADLASQAATLNRLAALVEKAGLPRDRVIDEPTLAQFIARHGDRPETWYLGHDYAGADIARFFAIAARDAVALRPAEAWLRARFDEARALVPAGEEIAMISVPNVGDGVDWDMRRAILDHEIGHGYFFTRRDIAAHVLDVWRRRFDDGERAAISRFLEQEGYDIGNETLVANEAMAYLVFTPDPRFFSAETIGVSPEGLAAMRAKMMRDFPGLNVPQGPENSAVIRR